MSYLPPNSLSDCPLEVRTRAKPLCSPTFSGGWEGVRAKTRGWASCHMMGYSSLAWGHLEVSGQQSPPRAHGAGEGQVLLRG